MAKSLSKDDLAKFQEATLKDYGIKLEDQKLYDAAFNLLQFFEALIKFNQEDKNKTGSKVVLDNPLITTVKENKIK